MTSLSFFVPAPSSDAQSAWRLAIGTEASWQVQAKDFKFIEQGKGLHIETRYGLERPKSIGDKEVRMTKKPDVGILINAILEALEGVVCYSRSQVDWIATGKRYRSPDGKPGVYIKIISED